MKQTTKRVLSLLCVVAMLLALVPSVFAEPTDSAEFAFYSTTDIHGKCWDKNVLNDTNENNNLLRVATVMKSERETYKNNVVLVDNGDLYQGTPVSTYQLNLLAKGESDWPAAMALCLSEIGYDMANVGNHEFNYGWDLMTKVRSYMTERGVASVCANLYYDGTDGVHAKDENAMTPYITKELTVGGRTIKIGLLGMVTPDCTRWDIPENYPGIRFSHSDNPERDMAKEAARYIPKMKAEGCDFIAVVFHSGLGEADGELTFSVNTENQVRRVIAKNSDIDLMVAGHDHYSGYSGNYYKDKNGKDVLVVNGGGRELTKTVFTVTKDAITVKSTENINLRNYKSDTSLLEKIKPYADLASEYVNAVAGQAVGTWDSETNYYLKQSNTMDLIQTAQMFEGTKHLAEKYDTDEKKQALYEKTGLDHIDVDMSSTSVVVNGKYHVENGPITMKDIYRMYRYDNNLYLLALTGQQIKDILEQNASTRLEAVVTEEGVTFKTKGESFTNPVFGGLNFEYDMFRPEGSRAIIHGFANGRDFDLNKTYIVGVNNYHLGNAGCGFGKYSTADAIWSQTDDMGGGVVQDLIMEFFRDQADNEKKGVDPADFFTWKWELTYSGAEFALYSTTDIHGKCWDVNVLNDTKENNNLLRVATVMKGEREIYNENVILVDNGDLYQGTPVSTYQLNLLAKGESDWPAAMALCLSEIGYDMANVGNHEFNYGWDLMTKVRSYMTERGVASVCANLYYDGTDGVHAKDENAMTPYITKELTVGGRTIKIGLLGMVTPDCTRWDIPENYPGIRFSHSDNPERDMAKEAARYIPKMKAEGCDFIAVVFHSGLGEADGELTFSVNTENQVRRVIAKNSDIDLMVAGHDHYSGYSGNYYKDKNGKDVLVVNGGGRELTKTVFTVTKDAITVKSTENINLRNYKSDTSLLEKIKPYADLASEYVNAVAGQAVGTWDSETNYYLKQSNTMDLIQTAQMFEGTKHLAEKYDTDEKKQALYEKTGLDHIDVDMSSTSVVVNGKYHVENGPITMKDIYRMYRYDNNLYLLALTGQQIKDILEQNASTRLEAVVTEEGVTFKTKGESFTNPVFGGLNFEYDMFRPEGSRAIIHGFANGRDFDLNKTYIVGVNNYHLGNAGCGFGKYSTADAIWSQTDDMGGGVVQDLIMEFFRDQADNEKKGVDPADFFTWKWELTYNVPSEQKPTYSDFTDLDPNGWYHDGINYMIENGMMNGEAPDTFAPHDTVTRAMLVTILYRNAGSPSVEGMTNPFTDVKAGKYYTDAVIWAFEKKITNGTSETTFEPDAPVTREQIATLLYRRAGEPKVEQDLSAFSDADRITSYARAAMQWAVSEKIISGDGDRLKAQDSATRAELATMLMRLLTK